MLKENIKAALMQEKPELVLKNANVVNVFSGDITASDIAINNGIIVGVGTYEGMENVDMTGKYIMPGFINAHCHVESSMVTPYNYSLAELMWGTTTIITDPHEIVNVAGHKGIEYILDAAKKAPINYYVQLPSCVPATSFENSGAIMLAKDLEKYKDDASVLGLGEMMNYVGVNCCDEEVLAKIESFSDMIIDGHAPGLTGNDLSAYICAGIKTDHESITYEEAIEKVRKGMAVLVREGGASKNLSDILSGFIREKNPTFNLAFATDDKHLYDIYKEGTIRNNVKKAISLGMEPVEAIAIATINAANIYGLKRMGAIAPGYIADIVVADNLCDLNIECVYKDGKKVVENRNVCIADTCADDNSKTSMTECEKKAVQSSSVNRNYEKLDEAITHSVNICEIDEGSFKIKEQDIYPVIKMVPGQIVTLREDISHEKAQELIKNGELLKIAVIERHHKSGNIGCGYIAGYGLKNGAVATTVAHDSHNLIVVGDNDEDMIAAVSEIERIQGGYAISSSGEINSLQLNICGLMSDDNPNEFIDELAAMIEKAKSLGVNDGIDPFTTLSFMALPVIPSIRITDMGMFDVDNWCMLD